MARDSARARAFEGATIFLNTTFAQNKMSMAALDVAVHIMF